jgi:single-strand DNA-binding protein
MATHPGVDVEDVTSQRFDAVDLNAISCHGRNSASSTGTRQAVRIAHPPPDSRRRPASGRSSRSPTRKLTGMPRPEWGPVMVVTPDEEATESFSEVVAQGRLGARVQERDLPSGDTVTVFTVVVDRPARERARNGGSGVSVDAIACQTFRSSVARRLSTLSAGDSIRVEGTLRRRFWRSGQGLGSAMEVDVRRLDRVRP